MSLAIAAIEIGRLHGHEFVAIGMPGHLLLREKDDPTAFYDPFAGARPLTLADCEAVYISQQPFTKFHAAFLTPVSFYQIVVRVLNNLQYCYDSAKQDRHLAWVLELLHILEALPPTRFGHLAKLMGVAGRFADSAALYDRAGKTHEADRIRAFLN